MMPWPNNDDQNQMTAVEPEVVKEMEREHLPDGKTVILCKQHDKHYIDLDVANTLVIAIMSQDNVPDEDTCPMTLLEKGE